MSNPFAAEFADKLCTDIWCEPFRILPGDSILPKMSLNA